MKPNAKQKKKKLIKNIRKNQEKRMKNKSYQTRIKNLKKSILTQIGSSNINTQEIQKQFVVFEKKAQSAVNKGVLHKNTSARYISRLKKHIHNVLNK